MKEVSLDTWEEVEATIPDFAQADVLAKFKLQKGKPPPKSFKVSLLSILQNVLHCMHPLSSEASNYAGGGVHFSAMPPF